MNSISGTLGSRVVTMMAPGGTPSAAALVIQNCSGTMPATPV